MRNSSICVQSHFILSREGGGFAKMKDVAFRIDERIFEVTPYIKTVSLHFEEHVAEERPAENLNEHASWA